MGLLSLSNLEISIKKAEFSDFKGLKVNLKVRLSIGLLNTYKTKCFGRNIREIRMAKKVRAVIRLVNWTKKSTLVRTFYRSITSTFYGCSSFFDATESFRTIKVPANWMVKFTSLLWKFQRISSLDKVIVYWDNCDFFQTLNEK